MSKTLAHMNPWSTRFALKVEGVARQIFATPEVMPVVRDAALDLYNLAREFRQGENQRATTQQAGHAATVNDHG